MASTAEPSAQPLPAALSRLRLTHTHHADAFEDGHGAPDLWYVSADIWNRESGATVEHVASFEFARVEPFETDDLLGVLDGHSASLSAMARAVIDPATDDLRDDLDKFTEPIEPALLFLTRAQVQPFWQKHGLGPVLAARAIRTLRPGCRGIAYHPASFTASPDDPDDEEGQPVAITARLKAWERIGFRHYRNGVFVLNLGTTALDDFLKAASNQPTNAPQVREAHYPSGRGTT
ncbi:hypothetical protein HUT15_35875 [Streptomyces sp. NA03103]|uniref:hypothetical protein n=1 Tax=Streptomyces sp. NA03103 TaxID=2742134 RepID=UPI001591FE55|nr:hypothetical protein [Streptomyces sp. NA03103]QKW65490.1 hypothetical protein HUT15_35875 [Streptomyces sp. NA03103]